MPIFEYACDECGETFEKLIRSFSARAEKIVCPACGSTRVNKKLSTFASKTSGGSSSSYGYSSSSSDCSTGGT